MERLTRKAINFDLDTVKMRDTWHLPERLSDSKKTIQGSRIRS